MEALSCSQFEIQCLTELMWNKRSPRAGRGRLRSLALSGSLPTFQTLPGWCSTGILQFCRSSGKGGWPVISPGGSLGELLGRALLRVGVNSSWPC